MTKAERRAVQDTHISVFQLHSLIHFVRRRKQETRIRDDSSSNRIRRRRAIDFISLQVSDKRRVSLLIHEA
jgi:hypothetical protein